VSAQSSALTNYLKKALLLGAVALGAFALAAILWAKAGRTLHRRLYRLPSPADGRVTPDELARTARIVHRRLQALRDHFDLGVLRAEPLPPDRIAVELSCTREAFRPFAWATMQGRATFHLLHPDSDSLVAADPPRLPEGYRLKTYRERRYVLTRLNELKTVEHSYAVRADPLLVVPGFQEVTMHKEGAQSLVVLTFHLPSRLAGELARITALHAGRRMAMLIDGGLFFEPSQIESAVSGGVIQVQGFFHPPPLRKLTAVLNCGSLPYRLQEVQSERGTGQ
jgi:preprotein translocase subunit SecD